MKSEKNKEEDIDVLVFATNNCYVEVVTVKKAKKIAEELRSGFFVDLSKGTWRYRGRDYKIGENKSIDRNGCGIIGVYNNKKRKQRDAMVYAATSAIRDESVCVFDD